MKTTTATAPAAIPAPFPEGFEPGTQLQFKGRKVWAPGTSAKFYGDPEGKPARFVVLNEIGTVTLRGEKTAARLDLVLPDGVSLPLFSGGTTDDCWAEIPLEQVSAWHKDGSNFNPKNWFRVSIPNP